MSRLDGWRENLRASQESFRGRCIYGAIFLLIGIAGLAPLCWSSVQYSSLRWKIAEVLEQANIAERNPIAVQLVERGSVTVESVEVGSARIRAVADQMFGANGKIDGVAAVSSFVAAAVAPGWGPVNLVERPWMVVGISVGIVSAFLIAVWVGMAVPSVIIVLGTTMASGVFWWTSRLDLLAAFVGIGFLIFLFLLMSRVALTLLSRANPVIGIARTVLLEAVRQKISVGFVCAMLVVLPLIPLWIDSREPLRYQIQTLLGRGTGVVFIVAAFLTLFMSCSTVAFEIRDRQIWSILTKPVSRFQYLIGKLFGLAILSGIVLAVGSIAVFVYVELLSTRPAANMQDAVAVVDHVLVARAAARPTYEEMSAAQLRDVVVNQIERDSLLRQEIADGLRSEADVAREIRTRVTTEFMTAQRSVDPGKSKSFTFTGLEEARKNLAQPVLHYAFHSGSDSSHETFPVMFSFGELPPEMVNYVPGQSNVIAIPTDAIDASGALKVTVLNGGLTRDGQPFPSPWSLNFEADKFEVLHRVGGFEANFLRAILIDWAKLIFIAALGTALASVLSYPVAILVTMTVFIIGSMSTFLASALENYSVAPDANAGLAAIEYVMLLVVSGVRWSLAPFGTSGGLAELVGGRVIPWSAVFAAVGQIGIVWSAVVFVLGLLSFNRKEIAIYSGGEG